jgi:enoyl-CoA hydratase/carnithine racemase
MTEPASSPASIDVTVRDEVAVITLNRPEVLNALSAEMRSNLAAALRRYGDGGPVRGIVLTGAGRAFSAGEDLREAARQPAGGLIAAIELFHDITRAVLETRVPVVAALNGIAVGGACEITLCCDARIGTPAAECYFPENTLGLPISNASSYLLPRLVGRRHATRLILESARIGAAEARSIGLLDEIVEPEDLAAAAIAVARRWNPPDSATVVHLGLLRPPLPEIEQAFAAETEAARYVDQSGIAQAGVNRFLAGRAG